MSHTCHQEALPNLVMQGGVNKPFRTCSAESTLHESKDLIGDILLIITNP